MTKSKDCDKPIKFIEIKPMLEDWNYPILCIRGQQKAVLQPE
jgi:hypothetical protein